MKRIYILILGVFLSTAGVSAFADQASSSLDDKPSVDSAASSPVQVPAVNGQTAEAADTHSNYLYDLKNLIEKSRANIKEVNEKIKEQAILKRNQKREERAREYYEKGVELTNEGKLDEAREYFEKAIRITEHPEMAGYIRDSQRRLRKQEGALQAQEQQHNHQIKEQEHARKEDVETAYKEAVDLYKQKKYHPAKDAFEHVDDIAPDYRATDSYLKIIDQDIITEDALAAKQQAIEIGRQQKEAEDAREKEKAMWRQQIEEKEKERKDEINKQAEDVYEQAVDLYKKKQFAQAKKKFEEVSWVIPDYKATNKYLGRIDRDAAEEQKRVAQEQEKALQQQRWEEEVERKKQEAEKQQALEAQERQHKKDMEEQAQFLYRAAVSLFDKKDYQGSLDKFNDIEKLSPDFKSTRTYIARIEQIKVDEQKKQEQVLEQQQKVQEAKQVTASANVPQVQKVQEVQAVQPIQQVQEIQQPNVAPPTIQPPTEAELENRHAQELKEMTDKCQVIYTQALESYRAHRWEVARAQFNSVDQIMPDFKNTHHYLEKIDYFIAREEADKKAEADQAPLPTPVPQVQSPQPVAAVANTPSPSVTPVPVKQGMSLDEQKRQALEIAALAEQSAKLYRQIADVANDSSTVQTKRKMAEVNEIINNLNDNKQRLLRKVQEEQWRHDQEALKAQREAHRAEAEKLYEEAQDLMHSNEDAKAKIKFLELENLSPDYRATRRYLKRIDEYLKKANVEAVTTYEQNEAGHLKRLEDIEKAGEERQAQEEQDRQHNLQLQQQTALGELATKASDINDDIIRLSKVQDYTGMKAKFTELEDTVNSLMKLKAEMAHQKEIEAHNKELARETADQRAQMLKIQHQEDEQIHSYYGVQPLKEYRPILSNQPDNADHFKRREIMQEQNMLYSEAVDRYEHKKFTQAKLLFGELAQQDDRRAEAWLKKVDRAITQELLKSQEGEERERTAFIEDQVKAQRELIIIQERERERQRKLSEELERQKRLYEDDRLLQLRKEEIMKVQERERERQEAKRLRLQKEAEEQQEKLRFHKIEIAVKPQPVAVIPVVVPVAAAVPTPVVPPPVVAKPVAPVPPPAAVVPPPAVVVPAPAAPPAMTPAQIKAQIDFSNRRKAFLDAQYAKEQREKERQKRIEEREEARQHEKDLRAQRLKERQDRLEAETQARQQLIQQRAQRIAQEQKEREDALRQQQQEREERVKQEEIVQEETQQRKELERQERERQAQLEAQRESVRRQLEDGVEQIYQDALSLYNQGQYAAALNRFKDVQDILPGYKRSSEYIDEALRKSLEVKTPAPASSSGTQPDGVSKELDLFDTNVK